MTSSLKSRIYLLAIVVVPLLGFARSPLFGQISITSTGASYSENFDGMGVSGTSYLTGWTGIRYAGTGTIGATLTLLVSDGSSNTGAVYNVGTTSASDRALGMIASGSTVPRIGAQFVNNTGVTITLINLAGMMEQWRSGSNSSANEIDTFAYSFDATSLQTGTWTRLSGMDLMEKLTSATDNAAKNGNDPANKTSISGTMSGITWTNGTSMWIRWSDNNDFGNDALLAIDDLTMSFNMVVAPPGKGTASITPAMVQGGISQSVTVTVDGQSPYTLTNTNVVVPSTWTWSHSTSDVVLTGGGSPSIAISGDTIEVSSMTVSGTDSIQVTINNITPPDSTDNFTFATQTGTEPDSILALPIQPSALVYGTPHAIGDIKVNDANGVPIWNGKEVTILGIVTVGAEFGSPSYIQDATGGIAVYGVITSSQIVVGDEVEIVGVVSPFNGLNELGSPTIIRKVSSGNVVQPILVNCGQVNNDGQGGIEQYEGMLVRINQVIVTNLQGSSISNWTVSGSGTNYRLQDAVDTLEIRVDNNVNYGGAPGDPAPGGTFDVIGVVSQYKATSPYIGGYQLMPRSRSDILAQGPIFATSPVESNLQPTSFRVSWTTVNNGTTRLLYGLTPSHELGLLAPDNSLTLSHAVDVTALTPATVYHVQAFSDDGASDTSYAGDLIVSTSSPSGTTGRINVYFNFNVDTTVSLGEKALGSQDLVSRVLTRINSAHRSIDVCLYSLSGASQGDQIASALIVARSHGVKIRVICEHDNRSYSGFQNLLSNGVPLIDDAFDVVWNGAGLMHNKFFVFDGRGGAPPESVWIWGGSWNPTGQGTTQDHQNSIEIQDVALANAYTTEFNEMWGSTTDVPNASVSRFGARKTDNTPHNFNVNGVPVSLYFSPSDQTTSHLATTIAKAQHSVSTCILTFTRKDLADSIVARKAAGNKTRVVIDNNTDTGNQYAYLQGQGVDVHLKGFSPGLLHHKYTVVDGDQLVGPAYLMTGSHNYSNAAEQSNDENTLILQNNRAANLYLQEFAARYYEAGGTDSIRVSSSALFSCNKSTINFDSVSVGGSKQDSFFVTNTGNIALTISSDTSTNPRFTVTPRSASVAPSASQKFVVAFSPLATGPQTGLIVLSHNAPGTPDTISVQGRGAGIPVFLKTLAAIDFDTVVTSTSKQDSFKVRNTGTALLKISSVLSSSPQFTVVPDSAAIMPSDSQTFVVTFSPVVPGAQGGKLFITHNAAGSPDSVSVQGVGKYPATVAKTIAMSKDWNMVSIPVKVANASRAVVFPNVSSSSSTFAYEGRYVIQDSLIAGKGYWLKFPSAEIDTVSGLPLSTDSLPISQRWNMIGSITGPVAVSSIIEDPPDNVQSEYLGYNGSYTIADTIFPGKAYWVKASQAGKLVLISSAQAPKIRVQELPAGLNQLVVSDADGSRETLWFGQKQEGVSAAGRYDLPPIPPPGAFDARFISDRFVEFHDSSLSEPADFRIALQAEKYPIKICWTIATNKLNYYTLTTSRGGQTITQRLADQGEMSFSSKPLSFLVLTVSPVKRVPEEFSLGQNYPNPFNPVTKIPFGVPRQSSVTITVYNEIGQVVKTLLRQASYEAGYYEVTADASQLASGVYYYMMTAVANDQSFSTFRQVKKLLILK
ncbi:MAG: phospholipase D-like domain-containing protein [Bacteroidota bacterium]